MKILVLANSDIGLFKFRRELLEELVMNHEIYVSVPDGEFINDITMIGCKVGINKLLVRRGINPLQDFQLLLYYIQIVKQIRPDIVFTYTIKPNIYGGLVCGKLHIPYVVNVTGLGTSIENGGILQKIILLLYKEGLKKAQKIFFQNENDKEYMRIHCKVKNNYGVLPGSGVNTSQFCYEEYPPEDSLVFTTIGRIMRNKGIDEILSAAREIKAEYPICRFRLIGNFDEDYKSKVEKYVMDGVIEYIEQQKDIHSFIAESHAILHASYHEGMSNVLLEGASTGRPVIATNVPGCRETYEEGISGMGFYPKDPKDLVRVLKQFIALPYEKKVEMGKAGRKKMEKEFDRMLVVNAYLQEIDTITEED